MDAAKTDTFAGALRAAIAARGLGLERIREHLEQHGVKVSLATLSYWQSGRSRPERRSSLAAIGLLEEVLALPPGHLENLLGPPRPRGRWLKRVPDEPVPISSLWADRESVEWAVRQVDTGWDDVLTRLSQHDFVTVGADRAERVIRSRHVLRAEADGADRWVVIAGTERPGTPLPLLRPVRHCAVGRTVGRRDAGVVCAELVFDRALRRGESIVIEHELVSRPPFGVTTAVGRKFRLPVREYVLEVAFDPAALPVSCEQYHRADGRPETAVPVRVDASGSLLGVALDIGPGTYGFRWQW
ncbi:MULTISPECIES: XRE family transcriptional regulator [unclassified Saccharothrix]|uniref:XRE family transcriptional regulator n=1 Tax=unclassified Saccharothrix TaxID=2593673 RepID=UPI00307EA49D